MFPLSLFSPGTVFPTIVYEDKPVYDGLQARGRAMEKVMDEEVASDQRQALKRGVGDGSAPRAKTARK